MRQSSNGSRKAKSPDRLPPEAAAKLQAAVQQALGQGYNLYTDRIDERWLEPLADAAMFFAKSESQQAMADNIMNNWRFQQTDQCRQVRKAAAELLKADAGQTPRRANPAIHILDHAQRSGRRGGRMETTGRRVA